MSELEMNVQATPEAACETAPEALEMTEVKPVYHVRHVIMKTAADLFTPTALTFGLYVILHGNISPGGGFQGGVLVSSVVLLIYLGYGYKAAVRAFNLELLHKCEAIAALLYIALAVLGIAGGGSFAQNVINAGGVGELLGSGTISYMNYAVGFKVITGIGFLMLMMLSLLAPESDEKEEAREVLHE